MRLKSLMGVALVAWTSGQPMAETTLTMRRVNNNDIITMQKLSSRFEQTRPDIKLRWVVLEENILPSRLTTDIATISLFEAPMWGQRGWLSSFDDAPASYGMSDLLQSVKDVNRRGVLPSL